MKWLSIFVFREKDTTGAQRFLGSFPCSRGCCETPKALLPYSEWEFIPLDIKGLSRRISTVKAWEPDFRNTLSSVGMHTRLDAGSDSACEPRMHSHAGAWERAGV